MAEIPVLASELATAIEITLNPNATQQSRMEAYVACEKYVVTTLLCVLITSQFKLILDSRRFRRYVLKLDCISSQISFRLLLSISGCSCWSIK